MTKKANMLSTMEPYKAVAGGYAETTMKKFEPVWMNKALSEEERDKIGMVAVSLLFNQAF